MQEAQNTKVVQEAYAAFGRGDVQGILDRLTDDVIWNGVYGAASYVPTSGERRGKAAVASSSSRWRDVTFPLFEPKEFVARATRWSRSGTTRPRRPSARNSTPTSRWCSRSQRQGEPFQEFSDSAAINAAYAVTGAAV